MEVGAWGSLYAVIGPEGLGAVGDFDGGEGLRAGVRRGEGDVISGMPVLSKDDVLEALAELVDEGDDLVAVFDCECAAGAEVVLDVDDEKSVGRGKRDWHSYFDLPAVFWIVLILMSTCLQALSLQMPAIQTSPEPNMAP